MRKLLIFLFLPVFVVGLAGTAAAVPIEGTYSTAASTLDFGVWVEDFAATGGQQGVGNSVITAYSVGGPGDQWDVSMTSGPATPFSGYTGDPVTPSNLAGGWDWVTPYSGMMTIGGSLTTGDRVDFYIDALNFNTTYPDLANVHPFTGQPLLNWRLLGSGSTSDGYDVSFEAWYLGSPYLNPFGTNPYEFGDLLTNINMEMTISRVEPVPEPATMLLLGTGLVGLAGLGRKRMKKGKK